MFLLISGLKNRTWYSLCRANSDWSRNLTNVYYCVMGYLRGLFRALSNDYDTEPTRGVFIITPMSHVNSKKISFCAPKCNGLYVAIVNAFRVLSRNIQHSGTAFRAFELWLLLCERYSARASQERQLTVRKYNAYHNTTHAMYSGQSMSRVVVCVG